MTRAVFSRASQCGTKHTYVSKREAKAAIVQTRERGGELIIKQERTRGKLRAYRCHYCDRFHIGHQSQYISDVINGRNDTDAR